MRINRSVALPTLVLALLAAVARAAGPSDGPDGDTLVKVAKSVVQVIASGCAGGEGDRAGSGFVLGSDGSIVTDLHVVAGCGTIQAKYQGIDQLPAKIVRVLKLRDLALLKVDHPPAVPGLMLSGGVPQVKEELDVIGFPLGLPAYDNTPLHVTLATQTTPELRAALRQQELDQLKSVGFPDLDTQVIRVDGNLLPGHSGAPLIDFKGQVAGVGSGGLEHGTVGIGWAIRAQYVADLLNSKDTAAVAAGGVSSVSFAAALPHRDKVDSTVKCGELSLVRRQVKPAGKLIASADDPVKLRRLVQDLTSLKVEALEHEPFAIWTEPKSGAGIAIPAGSRIEPGSENCVVHTSVPTIDYIISLTPTTEDTKSAAWELAADREGWVRLHQAMALAGTRMVGIDRVHSINRRTENGGLISRLMLIGQRQDGTPIRVFLNTLAGRGALIAIFVINRDVRAEDDQPSAKNTPPERGNTTATKQTTVSDEPELPSLSVLPTVSFRPATLQSEGEKNAELAWARSLLAVNFTAFPPLQATEPPGGDKQDEGSEDDTLVAPGARSYPRIRCGELDFIPVATSEPLADLARSGPVENVLEATLRKQAGSSFLSIQNDQFDAWAQPVRGATIFLPRGTTFSADPHACRIATATPSVSFTLRGLKASFDTVEQDAERQRIASALPDFMSDIAQQAGLATWVDHDTERFSGEVPPGGKISGRLFEGIRPDGKHVVMAVTMLIRDRTIVLFAMTDRDAELGKMSKADRSAFAEGLAAIRLSTLAP
jgi:S1-C subfamily serine protease